MITITLLVLCLLFAVKRAEHYYLRANELCLRVAELESVNRHLKRACVNVTAVWDLEAVTDKAMKDIMTKTPPRYSATSIQRAWLSGVTGADITALRVNQGTITAEFTHQGNHRIAQVHPPLYERYDVMERIIEDIKGAIT